MKEKEEQEVPTNMKDYLLWVLLHAHKEAVPLYDEAVRLKEREKATQFNSVLWGMQAHPNPNTAFSRALDKAYAVPSEKTARNNGGPPRTA